MWPWSARPSFRRPSKSSACRSSPSVWTGCAPSRSGRFPRCTDIAPAERYAWILASVYGDAAARRLFPELAGAVRIVAPRRRRSVTRWNSGHGWSRRRPESRTFLTGTDSDFGSRPDRIAADFRAIREASADSRPIPCSRRSSATSGSRFGATLVSRRPAASGDAVRRHAGIIRPTAARKRRCRRTIRDLGRRPVVVATLGNNLNIARRACSDDYRRARRRAARPRRNGRRQPRSTRARGTARERAHRAIRAAVPTASSCGRHDLPRRVQHDLHGRRSGHAAGADSDRLRPAGRRRFAAATSASARCSTAGELTPAMVRDAVRSVLHERRATAMPWPLLPKRDGGAPGTEGTALASRVARGHCAPEEVILQARPLDTKRVHHAAAAG